MGTGGGAEQVVGGFIVGGPVPQRLVAGIFEGAGASAPGSRWRHQLHSKHVRLPGARNRPHVDPALEAGRAQASAQWPHRADRRRSRR